MPFTRAREPEELVLRAGVVCDPEPALSRMELRRWEQEPEEWKGVRQGWCYGDEEFRRELLEAIAGRIGDEHYGSERRESSEAQAERIVKEELKKRRWTEQMLEEQPKGDQSKVRMAERLRRETTMTLEWIARGLLMGGSDYAAHSVRSIIRGAYYTKIRG